MGKKFLFRTDASPVIGTGHVMRCLALAQVLQDVGSSTVFLSATLPEVLRERLTREHCDCRTLTSIPYGEQDAEETAKLGHDIGAEWIVVDGYSFDAAYQDALKTAGMKLLFIDDYRHCDHYAADIILNQNVYASENLYNVRGPFTKLLLGTKYVLLRKEFYNSLSPRLPARALAKNVLLTLGGFAPTELPATQRSLEDTGCTVRVAEGNANMPSLMQWADMAISAGGTTAYELAYMGVPTLLLVRAENQTRVAQGMADAGCAVNLGPIRHIRTEKMTRELLRLLQNAEQCARMSAAGRRLVDGEGAGRVAMELMGTRLRVRSIRPNDAECIWKWANDEETRRASFSSKKIPWKEHMRWFAERLADAHTLFLMGLDRDDTPIGYVRFEGKLNEVVLSIAIAPHRRGQGYGNELLQQGCQQFFQQRKDAHVSAYVKSGNKGSAVLFQKAGFHQLAHTTIKDNPALHFILRR
ncbi:GNAT family N-acetyltransferase, partial [Candidatus Peregrinibacteria bacterium]|nr:GNAT family N-acetyltransferase [Candidatus Peregrinibacteria bacterium]